MNDNLSSIITPKNLVKDNLSRVMLLRNKGVVMLDHYIRARWKIMKFDFFILNVSLLTASQTVNFAISLLRVPITSLILLPSMKTLVSSANRIENNISDTLGRSLMQIKKNSGQKIFHLYDFLDTVLQRSNVIFLQHYTTSNILSIRHRLHYH